MEEIRREFIADAEELIEKLFAEIDQLREARSRGRERRELVSRIFRHVHTLKGSAASHDVRSVSQIAHEFETVLDRVRLGQVQLDGNVLNIFESAVVGIESALAERAETNNPALIEQLRSLAAIGGNTVVSLADSSWTLPEEIARSLSAYDRQHLREAVDEGAHVFLVSAGFEIDTFDRKFRELGQSLREDGEVVCTVPAPEPAAPGEINFRFLCAGRPMSEESRARIAALGRVELAEIAGVQSDQPNVDVEGGHGHASAGDSVVVRVGLHQLDGLISDASELFRDAATALESAVTDENRAAIVTARTHLRRRFIELEERLIKLRLVPLERLLGRAARSAGKIAARALNKEVDFSIEGGDVGIDRSLAEAVAHPLQHLVRNAVSHGIETSDARLAAGKSAQGHVTIAAFSEGGSIRICVSDDGRGIDSNRVIAAAVANGIMNDADGVTTEECVRLIFRPGFSTAEKLSDLSGRGIGLEVVDRAMAEIGGEIRVTTEAGVGTTFEMILPATLALLHCALVRSGNQVCCIESARIVGRGVLEREMIRNGKDGERIGFNGEELPLVRLPVLRGDDPKESEQKLIVVNVSNRRSSSGDHHRRIAVAIDDIEDEHEILVRSLGRHSSRWPGVTGATELLDGSVALVLDVGQMLEAQ